MSTIDTGYHNGARYSVIRQPQGFVVIDKQDHNHWVYGPVQSVKTARDWCVKLNNFKKLANQT